MNDERLRKFLEKNENLDLGNLFEYLQGIAEGLESEVRWKKREEIAGQSVKENDLQHTFKTIFLTVMCAVMENEWRKKWGLLPFGKVQLDMGQLAIMALVHDIGEIIEGDAAYFYKIQADRQGDNAELAAFREIVEPLPEEAKIFFIDAFKRAMPGCKEHINSRESRFFNAIENLSALKRGLHECRLGNLHFAPKLFDWHIKVLEDYSFREFPSLKMWFSPYIKEAGEYLEKFKAEREKYMAEFIKRGGKEKDFPF